MKPLRLLHFYPELLNLYGDRGNLTCLYQRLRWSGIDSEIISINLRQPFELEQADFIFMGGGSDREQSLVFSELRQHSMELEKQIEDGMPVLCICGAYQLLGQYYENPAGERLAGLELFNFHTTARPQRLIGNVVIEAELDGITSRLVGFENHGGRTYFDDPNLKPLGQVIRGYGNNGEDGGEGLRYRNLIGTYLHGPILPKNPALADHLLRLILQRRGMEYRSAANDRIEQLAHQQAQQRAFVMNS